MADDASYTAFLNKANEDSSPSQSKSKSTSQSRSKIDPSSTSSSAAVPAPLRSISQTYTSDTDSPFEPVLLAYAGSGLPSAEEFAKLIDSERGNVEVLAVGDFDPRGEYAEVVARVKEVAEGGSGGDVRVYRVEMGATRVEYYVMAVGKGGKLVGVVAKAVES